MSPLGSPVSSPLSTPRQRSMLTPLSTSEARGNTLAFKLPSTSTPDLNGPAQNVFATPPIDAADRNVFATPPLSTVNSSANIFATPPGSSGTGSNHDSSSPRHSAVFSPNREFMQSTDSFGPVSAQPYSAVSGSRPRHRRNVSTLASASARRLLSSTSIQTFRKPHPSTKLRGEIPKPWLKYPDPAHRWSKVIFYSIIAVCIGAAATCTLCICCTEMR